MDIVIDIIIGLSIALIVSMVAYQKHALSISGVIAAILIGTTIYVCGGWIATGVLLAFFVSSSLISRRSTDTLHSSRRTYKQVLANGLVGTVMIVLYALTKDGTFQLLYGLSFAVATADTWAGEIGMRSMKTTRHIISWKPLEKGMSGGVTIIGLTASLLGSVVISAFYMFHFVIIMGGLLGSVLDSILGTIQVKYVLHDDTVSDHQIDLAAVHHTTGISWLSNNLVNFLSNIIVVGIAFFIL